MTQSSQQVRRAQQVDVVSSAAFAVTPIFFGNLVNFEF